MILKRRYPNFFSGFEITEHEVSSAQDIRDISWVLNWTKNDNFEGLYKTEKVLMVTFKDKSFWAIGWLKATAEEYEALDLPEWENPAFKRYIEELRTTEDHKRRNSLAMFLSQESKVEMIPVIKELLADEKTANHRSTLVYSLSRFDHSLLDESVKEVLITVRDDEEEGYEAKAEAGYLVSKLEEERCTS